MKSENPGRVKGTGFAVHRADDAANPTTTRRILQANAAMRSRLSCLLWAIRLGGAA